MSFSSDHENQGPGWFEVIFAAWLAIALGASVAFGYLVIKPVVAVDKLPPMHEQEAGVVYYIAGNLDYAKGRNWIAKRAAWLEGRSVEFSEQELNAALSTAEKPKPAPRFGAKTPKKGEEAAPAPDEPFLVPGSPNFRVHGEHFQMSFPVRLTQLDALVIVQTQGRFEKVGEVFQYKPEQTFVGSMPLHIVPRLQEEVYRQVMKKADGLFPLEISEAWAKLVDIRIEDERLKLDMP